MNEALIIQALYRYMLNRDADAEGLSHYSAQLRQDPTQFEAILQAFLHSPECTLRHTCGYQPPPLPALPMTVLLEQPSALDSAHFEAHWEALFDDKIIIGQADYLRSHRQRFYELCATLAHFIKADSSLLEFGVSEASRLYRRLFPDLRFYTADRAVVDDYPGFSRSRITSRIAPVAHFDIDLQAETRTKTPLWQHLSGHQDIVLFCEVLEHLIVEPVTLLCDLLQLLRPEGLLYLSTPNVFSAHRLSCIARGENPHPPYPGPAADWDAHYHHREYAMHELLAMTQRAGGRVVAATYSACWDQRDVPVEQRGNLVLLIQRPA